MLHRQDTFRSKIRDYNGQLKFFWQELSKQRSRNVQWIPEFKCIEHRHNERNWAWMLFCKHIKHWRALCYFLNIWWLVNTVYNIKLSKFKSLSVMCLVTLLCFLTRLSFCIYVCVCECSTLFINKKSFLWQT